MGHNHSVHKVGASSSSSVVQVPTRETLRLRLLDGLVRPHHLDYMEWVTFE
jgi:hypothetical protein